ncbi:myogenesis-regulating glycosidase isoform X2 [Lingula anatina]|uniref:Myogenesis-regulating glycosidase isoform X2 n=1 Tax=Lingula anatina TaxID=7574 RepID=A0A1S3IID7_LINAN|nr:myogenesis-regulating glycosidase isoform X2 [Lingula anatina]|eukprot:XP_013397264.1 myogenesis-regulating glycosidase isoform X2 [Lingula anatina]
MEDKNVLFLDTIPQKAELSFGKSPDHRYLPQPNRPLTFVVMLSLSAVVVGSLLLSMTVMFNVFLLAPSQNEQLLTNLACAKHIQYNAGAVSYLPQSQVMNLHARKTSYDFEPSVILSGCVGISLANGTAPISQCSRSREKRTCLEWKNKARLVMEETVLTKEVRCTSVSWEALTYDINDFTDCYNMSGAHWYGFGQVFDQKWPIENWSMNFAPFVTHDSISAKTAYGSVAERLVFGSRGVGIYVPEDVPLFVSVNASGDHKICLMGRFKNSPYINNDDLPPFLKYNICSSDNALQMRNFAAKNFFSLPPPNKIPDERMFTSPIWSTWALYKKTINQSTVIDFADAILKYNFSNSQIEIDDNWTPHYGDMTFEPRKFPDPKGMVQQLHNKGFRVTVWVHPFASLLSQSYQEGKANGYFVKTKRGTPKPTFWWDGIGAILDATNMNAQNWFLAKLHRLKNIYGINSFKFDAGESGWLPPSPFYMASPGINPSLYSTMYVKMAYDADSDVRHQEVRVGWRTQDTPIFTRMLDKDSVWGYNNGLKTLIPDALTFGILGYPFILPDMIGGNAYASTYPDRELFIRWLEANVFLPSLQFSIPPWAYDGEIINISKKMIDLHKKFAPTIISLAKQFSESGAPIIRPLWWINATDDISLTIDSEFLLGDDLLVAPVLEQGARARDVYLVPPYKWRDERTGSVVNCGWHLNYKADLDELPYFTRIIK